MTTGLRTLEQECSVEIHLVRDELNSDIAPVEGSFMYYLFMAFLKADRENFELMRPLIRQMIKKYELKCQCSIPFTLASLVD